jgi:hypothetical protein
MERLEKLSQQVYDKPFKLLGRESQQVLIAIQRNEIEAKRNQIMETSNDIFRNKRMAS